MCINLWIKFWWVGLKVLFIFFKDGVTEREERTSIPGLLPKWPQRPELEPEIGYIEAWDQILDHLLLQGTESEVKQLAAT